MEGASRRRCLRATGRGCLAPLNVDLAPSQTSSVPRPNFRLASEPSVEDSLLDRWIDGIRRRR